MPLLLSSALARALSPSALKSSGTREAVDRDSQIEGVTVPQAKARGGWHAVNTARSKLVALLRDDSAEACPPHDDAKSWEHLLIAARDEGLCGLLLDSLRRQGLTAPESVSTKLAAEADHIGAANRHLLRRLEPIVDGFAKANIDLMVLKGAALLLCLYRDPSLRPMCDVDLLIHAQDADAADELLGELGFHRGQDLLRKDFYPRYHYEAEYLSNAGLPLRLDVHVRPFRPLRHHQFFRDTEFWSRSRRVSLGDTFATIPGDEDMLVHLACHAAFHGAERPLWLYDIHRYASARSGRLDRDVFLDHLLRWHLVSAARLGLSRAEQMFGPCLRRRTRSLLEMFPTNWRDRLALRQSPRDRSSPLMHTLVDLICMGGWGFRWGYLSAVLFPDRAHLAETHRGRGGRWALAAGVRRMVRGLWRPIRAIGKRGPANVGLSATDGPGGIA